MPKQVRRAAASIMNEKMKAKRIMLAKLSQQVRVLVESGQFDSINEALIANYSNGKPLKFNTFKQWKEKGFSVKKGEKAFLVWGTPRQVPVDPEADAESEEFKFWPVCYLFSEKQVQKRKE